MSDMNYKRLYSGFRTCLRLQVSIAICVIITSKQHKETETHGTDAAYSHALKTGFWFITRIWFNWKSVQFSEISWSELKQQYMLDQFFS